MELSFAQAAYLGWGFSALMACIVYFKSFRQLRRRNEVHEISKFATAAALVGSVQTAISSTRGFYWAIPNEEWADHTSFIDLGFMVIELVSSSYALWSAIITSACYCLTMYLFGYFRTAYLTAGVSVSLLLLPIFG